MDLPSEFLREPAAVCFPSAGLGPTPLGLCKPSQVWPRLENPDRKLNRGVVGILCLWAAVDWSSLSAAHPEWVVRGVSADFMAKANLVPIPEPSGPPPFEGSLRAPSHSESAEPMIGIGLTASS